MAYSKMKKEARKKMLKELKGSMRSDMHGGMMAADGGLKDKMKDKMKGMQKVTVMAKDKKGLLEGLEKAPEIMSKADKIMKARSEDDFACGGKKYKDGGLDPFLGSEDLGPRKGTKGYDIENPPSKPKMDKSPRAAAESGTLTEEDLKRYKSKDKKSKFAKLMKRYKK
jgi:hypothetical protein